MKNFLTKLLDLLIGHPKSTLIGVLVGVFTFLVYTKTITANEWVLLIGGVATIYGLLSKDSGK